MNQESVVPAIDNLLIDQSLDVRKIQHHAFVGSAFVAYCLASQGHFDDVTMAVEVAALACVVRDPVSCIRIQVGE